VTGGRGLIGSALETALVARGDRVVRLGRGNANPSWDPLNGRISGSLEGFEAVVHLAGEGIGEKRWTTEQKTRIRDSRVIGTDLLATKLAQVERKPRVLVSASAVGYYGNRGREELLDEQSVPGDDFLARLCVEWEAATVPASAAGIRVAHVRTGIVLTPRGGMLHRVLLPFKLGLGGKISSGRQYMSWITLADEVAAILHVIDHDELVGPVNLTAPHPVTNEVFTKLLAETLHRPAFLPTPLFALKAVYGAELVGTLLCSGQRVFPKRLEATGFAFEHVTLEAALRALLTEGD
jgi:uncharacterized protein (TIGR01777 family)